MKKTLACVLAVMLCMATAACSSTFGMEEQNSYSAAVSLKIGDYVLLGKYYDKPILWRCVDIDENGMLMLSEKLLCRKPFDASGTSGSNERRRYVPYPNEACSNYWGDSNIRSWLNSAAPAGEVVWLCGNPPKSYLIYTLLINGYDQEKGFLADGNFTQLERNAIKEVTQKSPLDPVDAQFAVGGSTAIWIEDSGAASNSANRDIDIKNVIETRYDEILFEYATDKVFLLDVKQFWNIVQNKDILGDDFYNATLTQEAIDNDESEKYKISQGESPSLSTEKTYNFYSLRTPVAYSRRPGVFDGQWTNYGDYILSKTGVDLNEATAGSASDNQGIRPAFYLNETSAQILSGSGTEEDPYVINGKKNDKIHVYCDWRELNFDVQPVNEDGRVLVPMRKIFETLGASITWDEPTRTVTAVKGETTVSLQIDQREMYVNGQMVWLDVPPQIVGDRTLIPIRAISEALGAKVEWLEESRRINITT